jgi:hypothetical protein
MAMVRFLYALLMDAAIETFAGGSAHRGWVAGIIAVYAAATGRH